MFNGKQEDRREIICCAILIAKYNVGGVIKEVLNAKKCID